MKNLAVKLYGNFNHRVMQEHPFLCANKMGISSKRRFKLNSTAEKLILCTKFPI